MIKKSQSYSMARSICTSFAALLLVFLCSCLRALAEDASSKNQELPTFTYHVVVLLDRNPHQKEVLTTELTLAEGIVEKLNQPGNVFTVIVFGSEKPALIKSRVQAVEAIAAIRGVTAEHQTEKYFTVGVYEALRSALEQFDNDATHHSLLIISEGNDYFPGKTFDQTVFRARQLQISCYAAIVAAHTLYGTKGIQRYGYYLRRLAAKTNGRYIGVGTDQKKTRRSVDELSKLILGQGKN